MTTDDFTLEHGATLALLAATAVYVVATRRRSWRAAGLSLVGIGLVGLVYVEALANIDVGYSLRMAGIPHPWSSRIQLWGHAIQWAGIYGLLTWAVVTDRPPLVDVDDPTEDR